VDDLRRASEKLGAAQTA